MGPKTKLTARFTTRFHTAQEPAFEGSPRWMTAREALSEYRDLKRGGTAVAAQLLTESGEPVLISDLEFDSEEWEVAIDSRICGADPAAYNAYAYLSDDPRDQEFVGSAPTLDAAKKLLPHGGQVQQGLDGAVTEVA